MIYFSDGKRYLDTRTLKIYEEILDENRFYRIHKKYVINLTHLTDYVQDDGYFAMMTTGEKLSVARARVPEFVKTIRLHKHRLIPFIKSRLTNAQAEGINRILKIINYCFC